MLGGDDGTHNLFSISYITDHRYFFPGICDDDTMLRKNATTKGGETSHRACHAHAHSGMAWYGMVLNRILYTATTHTCMHRIIAVWVVKGPPGVRMCPYNNIVDERGDATLMEFFFPCEPIAQQWWQKQCLCVAVNWASNALIKMLSCRTAKPLTQVSFQLLA